MNKNNFINKKIESLLEFKNFSKEINNMNPVAIVGISLIHKACFISAYCSQSKDKALVITDSDTQAQKLKSDLNTLGLNAYHYPARDFDFSDSETQSREYEHQRLDILSKIVNSEYDIIVASADAALQYTVDPESLKSKIYKLSTKDTISPEELSQKLLSLGFEREFQVDAVGQFSVRGGIFDIFSPGMPFAARLEFFGDEIDTISYFDTKSQRRTENIDSITIIPCVEILAEEPESIAEKIISLSEKVKGSNKEKIKNNFTITADRIKNLKSHVIPDKFISLVYEKPATLLNFFEGKSITFVLDPINISERIKSIEWQWNEDLKFHIKEGNLIKGIDVFNESGSYLKEYLSKHKTAFLDTFLRGNYSIPIKKLISVKAANLSAWNGDINTLCSDLRDNMSKKTECVLFGGNEKYAKSLVDDLKSEGFNAIYEENPKNLIAGGIIVTTGSLTSGFIMPDIDLMVITQSQVKAVSKRKKHKIKDTKQVFSLSDLKDGDLVVHTMHGIGIFCGIHKIDANGIEKDYLKIKYAKGDVLYIPVTQFDMVSKYIGSAENKSIKINRLGGSEWQKTKSRAKKAVKDIAKQLTKLYSERINSKGFAFSEDTAWQGDFEASFEYEETEDQLRCINEIKDDMEKAVPMDRLLCGDVGFGKTEVALRAAFKCIGDSKQCALLVPTTILAWQHYQTIVRRFEKFPVKVELLSRFKTAKEQEKILNGLKVGTIDMVIGTHKLVQKNVEFNDLGLVIIDEEQRFGVAQKERFKEMKKNIDVLTLSATPIPRTLNMAMSGLRDMSSIEEAPKDRHPVQTYVLEHDNGILINAIRRELRRNGQVYYLHNRVESIDSVAMGIKELLPDARIETAHGRMTEQQLSRVWKKMIDQEIDVLVCTTIIETGVDIPNVNTIIIDNADKIGLAQLHQLRGRVGRSSRRAYAYLTFERNKILSEVSEKRLTAIQEFTEFGSGFKIAMRDLEIRGAGNVLGGEQHGHMESIGYDLYIKLLNDAINKEKGNDTSADVDFECLIDIQVPAHIPEKYIKDLNQRLNIYKRISCIKNTEDSLDVIDELIDRFGEPPKAVLYLIDIALIRANAERHSIYEIKQQSDCLLLYQKNLDMEFVSKLMALMKGKIRVNASGKPYIAIKLDKNETALSVLKNICKC